MNDLKEKIAAFQQMLDESHYIVFFGGAGVSTESGIPDFVSVDGLYHQQYDYPPETILSHTFIEETRKNFTVFIKIRCCFWMQSPIWHTKSWRSGKQKAN